MIISDLLNALFKTRENQAAQQELTELRGKLTALDKSQARIEFDLNGMILDANEHFLTAMGYSLLEIKGKHHSIFVPSGYKDSEEYQAFWRQLRHGEFVSGEFKLAFLH